MSWRLSIADRAGRLHDVVVDASEDCEQADFLEECLTLGFNGAGLRSGPECPVASGSLAGSGLRHGMRLSQDAEGRQCDPGWYWVAVAGPDTGMFAPVTQAGLCVGREPPGPESLRLVDPALSAGHLSLRVADAEAGEASEVSRAQLMVKALDSTNGTLIEGDPVNEPAPAQEGAYVAAGSTTFGIFRVAPGDIAPPSTDDGPAQPFQRRFREALNPLPQKLKHPTTPRDEKESAKRGLLSLIMPMVSSMGMALMMMVVFRSANVNKVWIFDVRLLYVAVMVIGPLFMVFEGLRRRFKHGREQRKERADYEAERERFIARLDRARRAERDRDRWTATPAGLAALVARARHTRIWERSAADEDFCEIAVGLHDRPSSVLVEGRPGTNRLPLDTQWAMVLRHSLVRDGPLSVIGRRDRARALGRALLLDLAVSHSPNDLRIWLITDAESGAERDWNDARWLPHTFLGETQNAIFSTPAGRASALSALKSIINERAGEGAARRSEGPTLPVHVVLVDCLGELESEELADLMADGWPVGVIGVVLDDRVVPEGARAELTLGEFADEAAFVSETQPRAERVRSFEMRPEVFGEAARALARLRPAGSSRDTQSGSSTIRLVDLIEAPVDPDEVGAAMERWSRGGTPRIRVGGLGDLVVEIDMMRDGPHGLVGGTTRSGKTEFLKTLIVSLAVANHPDDLSIVIVDFKGGVDHELSARLPHVVDLSTNHDVDSFVRTIQLIEAELRRRQHEFKAVGAPNFDAYSVARRAKPQLPPIPRLLLIVDEFSELLSSEAGKANLSALESVTRVGGGLGVHLLLVTQNFENQLPSQIAANAGLRICFRVQESAHSKAVLDSGEAASIAKEQIGRAYLRSHGGAAVEFQAARVAGPRPGREAATKPVEVRMAPFTTLPDAPPDPPIVDVPAEDTDMHAVIEVLREAAARTGWTAPAVPWPKELAPDLSLADLGPAGPEWPVGMADEPDNQRQVPVGFDVYGPSMLLIGGVEARLGEVVRAAGASGAARRSPEELHFYVIDTIGQGLAVLRDLPHTGAVAERSEPLATRMLRHIADEVALRKAALSDMGISSVHELHSVAAETMPDTVLVVNGADRLLMQGESEPSPLLPMLAGIVSTSASTGVRVLMTGAPPLAFHRLGSSVERRFVLRCSDPHDYSSLGVPRSLQSALNRTGRVFDVDSGRLMQFALVPSTQEAPATQVVRALGQRLRERWPDSQRSALAPRVIRELLWPLPLEEAESPDPPEAVLEPVAMCVNAETGETVWLDADEDGPAFVVCGSAKSGRSSALLAGASLMSGCGWTVLGMPLSRRSPLTEEFPGQIVSVADLSSAAASTGPVALFIDDVHRWHDDAEPVRALLEGPGGRAVVAAGPTEYFSGRNELLRALSARCALVLAPSGSFDASEFGVRRLADDVLRDQRPGMGALVVAGEVSRVQVPLRGTRQGEDAANVA